MKIAKIDTTEKVLIVAEIGNNHEGRFEIAEKLVRAAAESKVDAVKFQTFRTEHYVDRADRARFERLKSFELSGDQFRDLAALARSLGLLFLSTPFDLGSVDVLTPLVDSFKISSGDLPFYPLISRVLRTGKPLILSSGASDIALIEKTMKFIERESKGVIWKERVGLLHCVSSYPAPADQIGLRAIPLLAERFGCTVGFSDHTIGIDAAVAAVAIGARIIEKHFTLDKNYSSFRDHQLSADVADMTELVKRIRAVEPMLGRTGKVVQACERDVVNALHRSIVAGRDLPAGTVLRFDDLTWTRPAGGIPPGDENRLIGKKLKQAVTMGHRFKESDVQ